MKVTTVILLFAYFLQSMNQEVRTISLDNAGPNFAPKSRKLGMMGPSDSELAERQARKDKNILELKMMIAESKKDNEIRTINATMEELEQNSAEIQDTMYAKLGELMNLVSRIRAQRIAGARVQVIGIKP